MGSSPTPGTKPFRAQIAIRDLSRREVVVRLGPPGAAINLPAGASVPLLGMTSHLDVGQDGRAVPTRHPAGRVVGLERRSDGTPVAVVRVARTEAGDEFLSLADDDVIRGVTVEMGRNGELRSVTPTVHAEAGIFAVRSERPGL